ncbi:hypothetical protein FRC08_002418 [Ceratobasidium sp. 394]|nr:hypothetical protein FRC08_002418 [Ceratobasidium sp. 394]
MTTATTTQTPTATMSSDSLALRFPSDGETSPTLVRPRPSLDTISAPFLAEEAYPRILSALLDTHLDDDEHRICLSEDNIAAIASAASAALFAVGDDVFARFLVVPRVESAISVLLWRVRINSTCAPGQSGVELPSVPVRVLASSLAGLLDNTKLYASSKQGAFPAPRSCSFPFSAPADLFTFVLDTSLQKPSPSRAPLDHHHLAPPTPVTATARTYSDPCLAPVARRPPPRLSFSRPMTPPDSAVVETTPISASTSTPTNDSFLTPTTPTSKRANLPRVKFRPPPIITRTTPSRPISRHSQSASAVTLTFAAAGLSGCDIEPLAYVPPKTKTSDEEPEKDGAKDDQPEQDRPRTPPPPSEPAPPKKPPARAPSPNPPTRPPSPTKRVLRKAPPTPKSRPRSLVRSPSPTKQQSMWAPSPAEAHYRSPSPVKLTPPVRPKSMLNSDSRTGSMENSPAPSKLTDLPSSLMSSPALLPKSQLRGPSPAPRTPSPVPPARTEAVPEVDVCSPSPSQSLPDASLRSPSSNLLRSPGSSMFNGSSVGFGSPAGSVKDAKDKASGAGASGDKTPVTPTPRRTVSVSGVKFEVIESPLPSRHASLSAPNRDARSSTPNRNSRSSSPGQSLHPSTPSRKPSPNQDAPSPSPNALRTRANLGASPGATSLSTVPSLSPFPESDSEFEFGGKDKDKDDEDVTLTARARDGLGLIRVEAPSRASTSTPTRKSPPPINTSPSRNSSTTKRSYTLGVPMTQLTSAGASLRRGGTTSESEAEIDA